MIFCSGKVYYDLVKYRKENNLTDAAAIIRIEQLYPLYKEKVARLAKPFVNAKKFIWCQEEPENMGAWTFILPNCSISSPATSTTLVVRRVPARQPEPFKPTRRSRLPSSSRPSKSNVAPPL